MTCPSRRPTLTSTPRQRGAVSGKQGFGHSPRAAFNKAGLGPSSGLGAGTARVLGEGRAELDLFHTNPSGPVPPGLGRAPLDRPSSRGLAPRAEPSTG